MQAITTEGALWTIEEESRDFFFNFSVLKTADSSIKFYLALLGSCARHLTALKLFDIQTFKSMEKKSDRKKILTELPVTGQSFNHSK